MTNLELAAKIEELEHQADQLDLEFQAEHWIAAIESLKNELFLGRAQIVRALRAAETHDPNCDSVGVGPDLAPSTKPCNCRRGSMIRTLRRTEP